MGKKPTNFLVIVIVILLIAAGALGGLYYFSSVQNAKSVSSLQDTVSNLQNSLTALESQQKSLTQLENANGTYPGTNFFLQNGSSATTLNPVAIYNYANVSIVTVEGLQSSTNVFGQTSSTQVLGTGFPVVLNNTDYIITNDHVVKGDTDISVTFSNGNAYAATVIGTDPYSDLAVLSVKAPSSEFHPLALAPSTNLVVGQAVVAIGNPFGLSGSETTGIVSQLGRTLQDPTAGNFSIANVIQISTPINPGNAVTLPILIFAGAE